MQDKFTNLCTRFKKFLANLSEIYVLEKVLHIPVALSGNFDGKIEHLLWKKPGAFGKSFTVSPEKNPETSVTMLNFNLDQFRVHLFSC